MCRMPSYRVGFPYMAPRKPDRLTIPQAIAAAVRRERAARGWNQEELAQRMQELGFLWGRVTVTEIERGDPESESTKAARQVSVEELLGLTLAFNIGLDAFLWNDNGLELTAGGTPKRKLPLNLDSQLSLWVLLMSASSMMQVTRSDAARLVDAELDRALVPMRQKAIAIAGELHTTGRWFEENLIQTLDSLRVQEKEKP